MEPDAGPREQDPRIPPGLLRCGDVGDKVAAGRSLNAVGLKPAFLIGTLGLFDAVEIRELFI